MEPGIVIRRHRHRDHSAQIRIRFDPAMVADKRQDVNAAPGNGKITGENF